MFAHLNFYAKNAPPFGVPKFCLYRMHRCSAQFRGVDRAFYMENLILETENKVFRHALTCDL